PGTPLTQLYVGGGTPTALPPELLDRTLTALFRNVVRTPAAVAGLNEPGLVAVAGLTAPGHPEKAGHPAPGRTGGTGFTEPGYSPLTHTVECSPDSLTDAHIEVL